MINTAYVNDLPFEFSEGESILDFVKRVDGEKVIPTLCDAPNLEAFGSCRVCCVDVALERVGMQRRSLPVTPR